MTAPTLALAAVLIVGGLAAFALAAVRGKTYVSFAAVRTDRGLARIPDDEGAE